MWSIALILYLSQTTEITIKFMEWNREVMFQNVNSLQNANKDAGDKQKRGGRLVQKNSPYPTLLWHWQFWDTSLWNLDLFFCRAGG